MQDRYVGDYGDFIKLAILRSLGAEQKLGVAWWHYPDESHNGDGRHIDYLRNPDKWRHLDPDLYDALGAVVAKNDRNIKALETSGVLPHATFHNEIILTDGTPAIRRIRRTVWFNCVKRILADCNMVFVDPDNGLETSRFSTGTKAAGKSVSLAEIKALSKPDRTLIVYHHQTRRKGGHFEELAHWSERLSDLGFSKIDAIRSHRYSARAFFILNAPEFVRDRARTLVAKWGEHLSWHGHV